MKRVLYLFLLLVCISCGTTRICVENKEVDIYVNGQNKGKGAIVITRMGPPAKVQIEAKKGNDLVGNMVLKRKFDLVTLLVASYTYGTGALFAWRYPAEVYVPIDMQSSVVSGGKNNSGGVWTRPPGTVWK